nr:MAG TPA: hypothetical protein [Caudoviricetes sp.]
MCLKLLFLLSCRRRIQRKRRQLSLSPFLELVGVVGLGYPYYQRVLNGCCCLFVA